MYVYIYLVTMTAVDKGSANKPNIPFFLVMLDNSYIMRRAVNQSVKYTKELSTYISCFNFRLGPVISQNHVFWVRTTTMTFF